MNKVASCLLTFLIFYRQEYLVAPQMTFESHGKEYNSSTCGNKNGTGGGVRDNKPRLLYYAYKTGVDFSKEACAKTDENYIGVKLSRHSLTDGGREPLTNDHEACVGNHSTRIESLNLIVVDLSTENKGLVVSTILNENESNIDATWLYAKNNISHIAITSNGPQLNTFYTRGNSNFVQQKTEKCVGASKITRQMIGKSITTPVVDWVTSNVYYISNSQIIICDQNFVSCATLPSANNTATETLFLAISSEQRLLFSVVKQKLSADYQLLAHSLDKVLKPSSVIRKSLINPKWITVDPAQERLYWMDGFERHTSFFYSSDFKGKNLKKIPRSDSMLDDSPFAVFNNTIYWLNTDQKKIMKCFVDNCINSTSIFKQVTGKSHRPSRTVFGYPIIDYHSLNTINRIDPCDVSLCSHLCLPESETKYRCYCQHNMKKPISLLDKKNGFCEDHTLLAAYKNILYVVGLSDDDFSTPNIREHKINVSSIAAVTYNSINGNVILTEVGQQKIHVWLALTGELKLILDEGYGTINSLAFDHYANNLYWIDPRVCVIRAMNSRTGRKVNILKGNSSYIPIQFALIPSTGYMSVLFLRENSSITIEYGISMDGISHTRQVLFLQEDIKYNVEDLSLYYRKESQTLCLLDRRANKIIHFLAGDSKEFQSSRRRENMSKIESLAFLKNSIVWSEEDLVIQKAQVSLEDLLVSRPRVPRTSLVLPSATDLDNAKNGVFRLFGIERQNEIPGHAAKCLQNNGGCQELEMCLVSPGYLQVSCVCPEGEELMSNTSYRRMKQLQSTQSEINTTTTLSEPSTQSEMDMTKTSSEPPKKSPFISVAYVIYMIFIVYFSTLGYLFVLIICSLKKRIGRSSHQQEELKLPSYWRAAKSCDDEYYYLL